MPSTIIRNVNRKETMLNKTQKFWDKQAQKYDYSERQFEPVFENVILETQKYLTNEDKVLDFGCATGTKTIQLAESVQHIHGLDISSAMIKEANKKISKQNLGNIKFSQGNIFVNDYEHASFDKIISYGVLHLLNNVDEVIRRLHNLLKPGGLFISTTACLQDKMAFKNRLEFYAYQLIKKLGFFPLHLNMFKSDNVETLIAKQGFQIVKAETILHGITISFIIARK